MKPSKSSVFCPSCRHNKLLFESKQKADRFILFNGDEILEETGRAPVRSYYCRLCCGWHVTSNQDEEVGRNLDRRDNKTIRIIDEKRDQSQLAASIKESRGPEIAAQLDDVERLLLGCHFFSAEQVLKKALFQLFVARRYFPDWDEGCRMLERGWSLQRVLRTLKEAPAAAEQSEPASGDELLDKVMDNWNTVSAFDSRLDAVEQALDDGTMDASSILELVSIWDDLTILHNKDIRFQKRRQRRRQNELMARIKEDLTAGDKTLAQCCLEAIALLAERANGFMEFCEVKRGRRLIGEAQELLRPIAKQAEKERLKQRLDELMGKSILREKADAVEELAEA